MKTVLTILIAGIATMLAPSLASAAPDLYVGDTAIYGGVPADIQPNVLIVLDTSGSMGDYVPGAAYDSATTYAATNSCTVTTTTTTGSGKKKKTTTTTTVVPCVATSVYVQVCSGGGGGSCRWELYINNISTVTTACPAGTDPQNRLQTTGQWNTNTKKLNSDGSCGATSSALYALGNWVNWTNTTGPSVSKMTAAKRVVTNLVQSTTGVKFGLMVFNSDMGGKLKTYNSYTASVNNMDAIFSGTTTNRTALLAAIGSISEGGSTPLGETLFETMRYFKGAASAFTTGLTYTSPIQAACQKNYVVFVTDGMSTNDQDPVLKTICTNGDCNGDGIEPTNDYKIIDGVKYYYGSGSDYMDDVAKYMYDTDLSTTYTGTQNVTTYTVGFGDVAADKLAVDLLSRTASLGHGQAFLSTDEQALAKALTQILGSIFEVNSSFVAPVVPVSPENRTYSGGRVYLGFFKPQGGEAFWLGNLKKYGIDNEGSVVDKNGVSANYIDNDNNGIDDVTKETLPSGTSNGGFRSTAVSYWTAAADGGNVDSGGVGQALFDRDFSTTPRKIYTYTGSSTTLTSASNAFALANAAITPALLGVATSTDRDNLINYVEGTDAYDDDPTVGSNGNTTEKRSWVLGDILHSKPLVVNYASYTFSPTNEANCSVNKTLVFAGANDGMLHAFRDCDGSEAWAFIPQDLLPNLHYLHATNHAYFVDGSPTVYRYDADNDGNIEPADGDRVILLVGEHRGGGYYYSLDVTDPDNPEYFWRIGATTSPSGTNTDYSELGETWSDVELAKIKIGSYTKMVGIVGAGYDNANEDGRYGPTQTYNGLGTTSGTGDGNVTSTGTSAPLTPKGRGVYVVEIATVSDSSGVATAPSFTSSGWKVWGYTYATNNAMSFSIPSAVSTVDIDYNGFIDRFYVGDAGGTVWGFDIGNTNVVNWTARRIFSSNIGSLGATDRGRKIFYPPSVVFEVGYTNLAVGTGDREHPLNTAVVDRLYSLKDRGQSSPVTETASPSQLVDLTDDMLQASTNSTVIANLLSSVGSQYGWYIRLENAGEKVLAPPLTFFYSYYSTYTPDAANDGDPCVQNALGTGRLYVVDYKTGESVYNYDVTNDSSSTTNTRAKNAAGETLVKSDRVQTLGSGIPSGVVPVIPPDGKVSLLVGVGGGLPQPPPPNKDVVIPLYWRRVL